MSEYFDALETRSADERSAAVADQLPQIVARAQAMPGYGADVRSVNASDIKSADDLVTLPVLRKSDLLGKQADAPPFGGLAEASHHIFQSPGPIYEPGMRDADWWRMGRFLNACGVGASDVVQNCFSYHFTPAGMIFESGAAAVGAAVFPAGTGQTELQVRTAADIGTTTYAGTPDFLQVILEKSDEMGVALPKLTKAVVGGGPLFPALRAAYAERGITCLQNYATADLGNIAYESPAMEGMIVDEGVIVEIVTPGTGTPVKEGEIGEVVVTAFNHDYPLIRFATGDLSSVMPGQSPCGRTNMRITGWKGRADQSTKVKGMFVRPEQVADLVARHDEVQKARVVVGSDGHKDIMTVKLETTASDAEVYAQTVKDVLKLRGAVELVAPGSLPTDGIVIEDTRDHG